MKNMLAKLRFRARALKTESYAIYLAARDPRTPWAPRIILLLVAAYAISPLDLIPDFIPVLGIVDDLIIVPAGIRLALGMIQPEVMADARNRAKIEAPGRRVGLIGVGIILLIWIMAIIGIALISLRFFREKQ
jgi:uncharacterized membrane protein YkvA (DUF1232 family)